jgi:hypothetical protein
MCLCTTHLELSLPSTACFGMPSAHSLTQDDDEESPSDAPAPVSRGRGRAPARPKAKAPARKRKKGRRVAEEEEEDDDDDDDDDEEEEIRHYAPRARSNECVGCLLWDLVLIPRFLLVLVSGPIGSRRKWCIGRRLRRRISR